MLGLSHGGFLSLADPPEWARSAAAGCDNLHTWPVLAGEAGRRDLMLSAPVTLPDHPAHPDHPTHPDQPAHPDQPLSSAARSATGSTGRGGCSPSMSIRCHRPVSCQPPNLKPAALT